MRREAGTEEKENITDIAQLIRENGNKKDKEESCGFPKYNVEGLGSTYLPRIIGPGRKKPKRTCIIAF